MGVGGRVVREGVGLVVGKGGRGGDIQGWWM